MFRFLIVEDDDVKRKKIINSIQDNLEENCDFTETTSLRSGLKELISSSKNSTLFDFLLLDMSMPNFDITSYEPAGGNPESFAGKEIMTQMKLRKIVIPTIVITQYNSFEKGSVTLDDLRLQFSNDFGEFFLGAIYYSSLSDSWEKEIISTIKGLK